MKKTFSCFIPLALAAIVCGAFFPRSVKVTADNPAKAVTQIVTDGLTYRKFEYEDNGKQNHSSNRLQEYRIKIKSALR